MKWREEMEQMDVETAWQKIKGVLTEVIEECVPWTVRKEDGRPKWCNKEVNKIIKKKKEAWKRWKRT